MSNTAFLKDDYKIIKRDVVYQGVFRMVQNHISHKKFDGSWTETYMREICERPPAVGVILYDPKIDSVVLIEQFRAGAMNSEYSPWLIEVVAGIFDRSVSAEELAKAEASEEAGAKVLALEAICRYFVSPGETTEFLQLFCGHVDASQMGGVHGLDEEHENIRAFVVSLDEAMQMLEDGKILTAPVIVTLQWLVLNREKLKKLWLP